ncbi:hypothetical protein MLD38_017091 [Melastoma candidum]|uniref:Uncharacterized protein n=1 Tax=Melastoma candidum TaxID=119954 RepID=A0ACB9QPI2_9MYRT|nr:hypothetical protein MLD38_017091 [Melastoma candidum]
MGGICCCARMDEYEEYYPSNSMYGQCLCLRYFFHQLFTGYTAILQRPQGRSPTTAMQGSTSLASSGNSGALPDNSAHDIHLANRPPPYDSEQRYSRLQRDGLVSRREKSMTHFQEESLPLRRNASSSGIEALGYDKKRNSVESEGEVKVVLLDSEKLSMRKVLGLSHLQPSSEDEDVCPTCLEEYTTENPKIMTKCSHHFHLGCIYEWMERSESCPICGKEMEFCETAMG